MSQTGNCCPRYVRDLDEHAAICRDDNCTILGLHEEHEPVAQPKEKKGRPASDARPLWRRSSSKALDHAIANATSKYRAKHFTAILQDVRDDYGDGGAPQALERAVYRHLKKLVERGHVVRLDLGASLAAYVRPKSRLVHDLPAVREQIMAQRVNSWEHA